MMRMEETLKLVETNVEIANPLRRIVIFKYLITNLSIDVYLIPNTDIPRQRLLDLSKT